MNNIMNQNMNMMNQNNMNMMMNQNSMNNTSMMNMMIAMRNIEQFNMMMMNNFNNVNNNNNFNINNIVNQNYSNNEFDNNLDDEQLNIYFQRNKKNDNIEFKIRIICKYDELVKDVIDRYCFKTNEKKEELLFLFNSKKMKENETVQNARLMNMSRILVIDTKQLIGGKF